MHDGSDMSICAMEIGWHDKRGQHGCVLDRMCLYAPIRKYKLLRMRLGDMTDAVNTVACWVRRVYIRRGD